MSRMDEKEAGGIVLGIIFALALAIIISRQLFPFFLGLIPEGWLLDLTSRTLKIDPKNPFDILLATGGDCIGAVKIVPLDEENR